VKFLQNSLLVALAALAPLVPLAPAAAQDLKPVAVVAIASVEETLADIGYLAGVSAMEDAGKTARLFGSALTSGMDKKRPAGMYVIPKDGDFHAVAFIPVTDLKQLLGIHKEYIGEPKDVGDGVLEIGMEQSAFVKEQNGWAFVAQSAEHLTDLPRDPALLLGDLAKEFNAAIRIHIQNVPQELKNTALDEIKFGIERTLDNPPPGAEIDRESIEQTARSSLQQLEQLFNEGDELTVGLAIDAAGKRAHLDIKATAKDGTELARQAALNADVKSAFAGILDPQAAVTMNLSAKLAEKDIARTVDYLKAARSQLASKIDDDPNVPAAQRAVVKEIAGQFTDVFEQTVKTGKIDAAVALLLENKSFNLVGGGHVADGAAFEKAVKQVVDLAKNDPNAPKVQFNAATHGNVALHKLSLPVPAHEAEAREMFGEQLDVVLGTGPQAVYLSAGKNSDALLKKAIDQSSANAQKPVAPFQLDVAMLPILKFSAAVSQDDPILPMLVKSLEQSGSDRVILSAQPVPRGSITRLEIQEGVLKLIGVAAQQFSGGNIPGAE
jgi:hypothetical protein